MPDIECRDLLPAEEAKVRRVRHRLRAYLAGRRVAVRGCHAVGGGGGRAVRFTDEHGRVVASVAASVFLAEPDETAAATVTPWRD